MQKKAILVALFFILEVVIGNDLVKYEMYENTDIADKFKANFTVKSSFNVSKYNPKMSCLVQFKVI